MLAADQFVYHVVSLAKETITGFQEMLTMNTEMFAMMKKGVKRFEESWMS